MQVLSVNTGQARLIMVKGRPLPSAIDKRPVDGRVAVHTSGLAGDEQVELRKMGALHHAVHAYPHEHYMHWQQHLGLANLAPGHFGENLTVRGMPEDRMHIGDVLAIGTAVLQVAQPRIPCGKLNARAGMRLAPLFVATGRSGYYLRVLRPGTLGAGDAVTLLSRDPRSATVAEFLRVTQREYWDAAALRDLLQCRDLMPAWHETITAKLQRAEAATGWHGLRALRIVERSEDRHGHVTLRLDCARGRPLPPFQAGQHLSVVLQPDGGGQQRRNYVLSSPPQGGPYRITVRPDPASPPDSVPQRVAALRIADALWCTAPHGAVTLPERDSTDRPVVLFCAGLGWAAAVALLHALHGRGAAAVHLFEQRADDEPTPLRDEALDLLASLPNAWRHPLDAAPALRWAECDLFALGSRAFVEAVGARLQQRDVSPAILRAIRCDG